MSILESTVKKAWKETKNTVLQVPEIERKVKEATSNEKWGPSGTQMREIAKATFSFHDLPLIMNAIWRRLNDHGKYWRHVYKSLLLIDYLLHNGSEQVIRECRDHIVAIQTLTEFQYIDERDQDVGLSVRERAKLLVELIHDEKRLKTEREKAKNTSKKFLVGMGSEVGGYDPSAYEKDRYLPDNYERETYERENYERESPTSTNRHSNEPEEYNEEDSQPQRANTSSSSSTASSSSSSSNVRPRAPSGGTPPQQSTTRSVSNTPASTQPPPVTKNIFDIDDVMATPAAPSKKQELDFFNMPASSFTPQTRPGPSSFPPSNVDGFDPRGNPTPSNNTSSSGSIHTEWADFTGSSQTNAQPDQQNGSVDSDKKQDAYDPWNQKHLFDLGLDSKATNAPSTNKTPIGAMGYAPMGNTGSKAMGPPSTTSKPMGMGMTSTPTTMTSTPTTMNNTGMGMNTGMTMGMNPGMTPTMGMNPGMSPGMGMNTGMGMNPGMGMGMNPGMGMGMNQGMGMNPGMGMGMNQGMGMNPGMGMAVNPGMNTGMRPVMSGTPMGMNPNTTNSMGRGTTNSNTNWNPF